MTMQAHILRAAAAANAGSIFPDYAAFLAYITGVVPTPIQGTANLNAAAGLQRIYDITAEGSMYGTTWGSHATFDSRIRRAIQHGLPSQAIFNSQVTNAAQVLTSLVVIGDRSTFNALNRNGFQSNSYAITYGATELRRLVYWDFDQGAAFEMNPRAMTGPVPYEGE